MENKEERTVLPGYLYWTVVVVTLFIIFFPSIFAPRKEGLSTVPTVYHASKQPPEFSHRYDEFSKLVLRPNRTYTITFDEPGTTQWIDGLTHRVYYRIESSLGHTTHFSDNSEVTIIPGKIGGDRWLGNKNALLKFRITSNTSNIVTIRTSTRQI